ncbi:MAG: glycosyltransferase family 39 protein [Acidobacteriota bacterium]
MKILLTTKPSILLIILVLAIAPYFIKLGASSLWDANEAFYAETPREMIAAGDYLNPSFNFKPRFNKPPLCYWVVAAFYKLFGVSEATERLPLALGALAMILTAFFLGRAAHSSQAGLFAAIALATLPRFVMFSRRIIIDVYIAMFMGLTLLFFALAEKYPERRKLFLMLMYVSAGLGVLTKGPVALLLPAIAFTIYLTITGQLKKIRAIYLPSGVLIVAAIVLPWYAAIYFEHGLVYIKTFLLKDNLSRYTEPIWGPRRGYFFYLPVMLGDLFPWSFFLFFPVLAKIFFLLKRFGERYWKKAATAIHLTNQPALFERLKIYANQHPQTALLIIWIAVIVGFYSLSSNKEDLYISPIYTAAASLVGIVIANFLSTEKVNAIVYQRLIMALGIFVALLGMLLFYVIGNAAPEYQLAGEFAIALIALLGGLTISLMAIRKNPFASVASLAMTFVVLNWIFVLWTLPDFERYKPVRALCEVIKTEASPDAQVGYYAVASPSMVFYLQKPIFEYYQPDELIQALANHPEVYCIISQDHYEALKGRFTTPTRTLATRPVFQVKLRTLFNQRDLPQVVLITNKSE